MYKIQHSYYKNKGCAQKFKQAQVQEEPEGRNKYSHKDAKHRVFRIFMRLLKILMDLS